MTKARHCLIVLLIVLLCACTPEAPPECTLPPKGFSDIDLVGTWDALDASGDPGDNSIIIREDGEYKQIMNVKWQDFKYESDWKPWKVSYSDEGLPYLHLKGFLMCAYWFQTDCRTEMTSIPPVVVGDTKDPFGGEYYWYDGCQRKWINAPGEGIFAVLGAPAQNYKRGIILGPFTKSSDSATGPSYSLREP